MAARPSVIIRIGDAIDSLAVDTAAGGRISSLVLNGRERILTRPAAGIEPTIAWGCYLMAPFVGRISGGSLAWGGGTWQLPRNNGHHSIHGAVFDREWAMVARTESSLTMTCRFDPARWPFRGSAIQRLEIVRGRLRLEAEVLAEDPMPAAVGWHPWFRDPERRLRVELQSDAVLQLQPDLIPTGALAPVDSRTDLRGGAAVGGRKLDDVYVAVRPPVVVTWPDIELTMAFDNPVGTFVVCTHQQGVCVEPMTAWPDSIRLAGAGRESTGLVSLAAGERLAASTTWTWSTVSERPLR